MKLKTEMFDAGNGRRFPNSQDGEDVDHDAAAAHALMMAIDRWSARRADHASYATFLLGHADEIMAQWGFDSGEVEG